MGSLQQWSLVPREQWLFRSAAGRAPSSGGRTSRGAPWPVTSCTHTPAGMSGSTKGRAQPGPGRPPGRARSAQLATLGAKHRAERRRPGSTFRCGEASAMPQVPDAACKPRPEALQAVEGHRAASWCAEQAARNAPQRPPRAHKRQGARARLSRLAQQNSALRPILVSRAQGTLE